MSSNPLITDAHLQFNKLFKKTLGDKFTGFGEAEKFSPVQRLSLSSPSINAVLGGGVPLGRIIELYAENSVGKSTMANYLVSQFQQQGKFCLWLDAESCLDPEYLQYCGVDNNKLCLVKPTTAEETLDAARESLKVTDEDGNSIVSLIVIDSVASLVPSDEYQKESGSGMVASLARLLSQSLKQLSVLAAHANCTILLLNQKRSSNLMGYGAKTSTAGGTALKYYASIRLELKRSSWLEEGKVKVGQIVNLTAVKNKTAIPYVSKDFTIRFPIERNGTVFAGVDVFADIIDSAIEQEIIQRTGAWYLVPSHESKLNGLTNVYNYYLDNHDHFIQLKESLSYA